MRLLLRSLLEGEELVGTQIAFVVRRAVAGQDRLGEVVVRVGGHPGREHTSAMADLFSNPARQRVAEIAPLPQRMRPQTRDEFVGQTHVLGEASALRLAIEQGRMGAAIIYGPPGSGTTTPPRATRHTTG